MKLILYFCILILGHSAFAGSSGGFDDDDTPAKPTVSKPAPSKPAAPAPAPVAPIKVNPTAGRSFPQCGDDTSKWSSNAEIAKEMVEKVLKFDEDFPIKLAEDKPCTGYSCAKVFLTKDRSGVLMITFAASSTSSSASRVCQSGNKMKFTADTTFGEKILVVSRKNDRQVDVQIVGHKDYDNSYTVGTK